MPARKHLTWTEIREFGGLWTNGGQTLMPANAAQMMSGCHPQSGGGLRAFHKVTSTIAGTGLATPQEAVAIGFGTDLKGAPTDDSDTTLMVVTVNGTHRMRLPGAAGDKASAPDEASFDITGGADLDIRAKISLDDWTPANQTCIIGNLDSAAFAGYELRIQVGSTGIVQLGFGDGTGNRTRSSTVATGFTDGTAHWIRATLDVDNGAAGHTVNFYTSDDGVTWAALGAAVVTAGVTALTASSRALTIGSRYDDLNPMTGYFYAGSVRNGIPGTEMAGPDVSGKELGATSFTDPLDNVFTLAGNASIVDDPAAFLANWTHWRWEIDEGAASWTASGGGFTAGVTDRKLPPPSQPQFVRFTGPLIHSNFLAISLRESGGTLSGLYLVDNDAGTLTRNVTRFNDQYGAVGVVEHQARLVVGYQDKLYFSPPGENDFTAPGFGFLFLNQAGFLTTVGDVHEGPLVAWMVPVPPGDFIVATRDGRIYNVQGDLGDPTVLELGRWTTMVPHEPANTPNGIFFILPNQGVHALGLDGSVTNITPGINPAVWNLRGPKTGLGQLVGTERFLFAPNQHTGADHKNGALVFDFDTKAWFTSTHADDNVILQPRLMQPDNNPHDSGVWVLSGEAPESSSEPFAFHIRTGGADDQAQTEQRNTTWEWESAPLRSPMGRFLDLRLVEIPVYAFNGSSTLSVTVGGTTRQVTPPAGRSVQTFLFKARGSSLSVRVKSDSNSASTEAPMIEAVNIGWKDGPQL